MAYTLANLQTDIRNYTEVDDTVFSDSILDPIIKNAGGVIIESSFIIFSVSMMIVVMNFSLPF